MLIRHTAVINAVILLVFFGPVASRAESPLFASEQITSVVLSAPLSQIYKERGLDKRLYHDSSLSFVSEDGATDRLPVKARTRGNYRRSKCSWPPLFLNFKKSDVKGTLFDGQDKLKLVSPCKKSTHFEQYIALEHLAYQLYEVVSPDSFDTRLLRISFVDSENSSSNWTRHGFFIESTDEFSQRRNMKLYKKEAAATAMVDPDAAAVLEIFQFMIGNNDYSLLRGRRGDRCCHNVVLMRPANDDKLIPVPYDFDFSGLVDANYAEPPPQVPYDSVTKRYFRGLCQSKDTYKRAITHVVGKRPEVLQTIDSHPALSDSSRKKARKFIEQFYTKLDSEWKINKEIFGRCRGAKK